MKLTYIPYIFVVISCLLGSFSYAQQTTEKKLTAAEQQQMVSYYQAQEEKIFFPATLPTTSIYEETVEQIYGKKGLNLPTKLIAEIKQFYCFLEFLTKCELVVTQQKYASYKKTFEPFLQPQKTIVYPTQELVQNSAWKNIAITEQELMNSTGWQNILRSTIADSFIQDAITLEIIHQVESQIFNYLPSIEVNYYNYDFVRLKNLQEITRVKAILQHHVRARNIQASIDFANQQITQIVNACTEFKSSEFYIHTHNLSYWTNPEKQSSSMTLASPLKEQIWLYFMMQYIQTQLYATMTQENLLNTLIQAGTSKIIPNFFYYTPDDYAYLQDFLSLKQRFSNDHTKQAATTTQHEQKELLKPEQMVNVAKLHQANFTANQSRQKTSPVRKINVPTTQQTSDEKNSNNDVQVQSFWSSISNFASSVAHSIVSTAPKIWNDIKQAGSAIEEAGQAAVEGTIGIGADMVGIITDNPALEQYGSEKLHQAAQEITQATTNLEHDMQQIGSDLKNGFQAPIHELDQDFDSILSTLKHAAQNAWQGLEAAGQWIEQEGEKIGLDVLEGGAEMADFVANSVETFYVDSGIQTAFKTIIHGTVWLLCKTWFYIKKYVGIALTAVMKALATVTNAVTSAIIWTTKSIVYLGAEAAHDLGYNVNPQAAEDKVDMYLEAHRSSINVGVGIVLAIAVDVAVTAITAGAGAAFASASVAAEGTATVADVAAGAADVAGVASDAAEGVTSIAADAGDVAAQAGEEAATTAESAGEETAEQTGEEATEQTTKEAGEDTAKDSAKDEPSENNENEGEKDNGEKNENEEESNAKKRFKKFKELFKDALKKNLFNKMKLLMTFVNVGFNSFGFISSLSQNAQAITQQNTTFDLIRNLWSSNEESSLSAYYNQQAYLDETSLKLQAQLGNNMLGLLYQKNYINASTNMNTQQLQTALSSVYTNLLTPVSIDSSNPKDTVIPAAIGNMWGLDCPFISLYPSQGFLTCTKGRIDLPYAQEIACAPLRATLSSDVAAEKNGPDQFWFNQRAITLVEKAPTTLQLAIKLLYTLTTPFHFGLYVGGTYYNYTSTAYLQKISTNGADLDAAHLAKMFVLNKPTAESPVHIGIYEHEGSSWLINEPLPQEFLNYAYTYIFTVTFNQNQITATLSTKENPNLVWQKTVSAQPTDTRTFGVIYSGAALAWNVLQPTLTPITDHASLRPPFAGLVKEEERETVAEKNWQFISNPTFGNFHLAISDMIALLNGQYVYTTQDTKLQTEQGQPITDYVVFAQYNNNAITNIGMQPLPTSVDNGITQVLISLITDNVYDTTGKVIAHQDNTYASYQTKTGTLATSISQGIEQTNQLFVQQFAHLQVGPFDVTAISMKALCAGYRIYTCTQTIQEKNLGAPITDYLLFVNQESHTSNLLYGQQADGLYSLITQNSYNLTSLDPIKIGDALNSLHSGLQTFDQNYKAFAQQCPQEHQAILTATTAYLAAITPTTPVEKATPVEKPATTTIRFSGLPTTSFAPYQTPHTQGIRIGNVLQSPALALPTPLNLLNQQRTASGGFEIQTGGMNAQGGGLKLGAPVVQGGHGGFEIPTAFKLATK